MGLSLLITFVCLIGLVVAITYVSPRIGWSRKLSFCAAVTASFLLFIPSCAGVLRVVNHFRYGLYEFQASASVSDSDVKRYLPPQATEITVNCDMWGFDARYRIAAKDVWAHIDGCWERNDPQAKYRPSELAAPRRIYANSSFQAWFAELGWQRPWEASEHRVPTANNLGWFVVWYDADTGIAYQHTVYTDWWPKLDE